MMTKDELDAVLELCAEQMVDAEETQEEEDFAYNRAITDCMDAIRAKFS